MCYPYPLSEARCQSQILMGTGQDVSDKPQCELSVLFIFSIIIFIIFIGKYLFFGNRFFPQSFQILIFLGCVCVCPMKNTVSLQILYINVTKYYGITIWRNI